ncbi:7124_t:CDS:2 [Ambispora leptoticha]|uniref:7124_t:CDS:1 n=1 Tax=Ambispora leptoticha TaxID=144679 RepID=A0A9N9EKG3_9GLOM|nr:7124_t:CDS:2 [Ambispora leptoticha]
MTDNILTGSERLQDLLGRDSVTEIEIRGTDEKLEGTDLSKREAEGPDEEMKGLFLGFFYNMIELSRGRYPYLSDLALARKEATFQEREYIISTTFLMSAAARQTRWLVYTLNMNLRDNWSIQLRNANISKMFKT